MLNKQQLEVIRNSNEFGSGKGTMGQTVILDLLNHITALQAENERHQWISVKNKLPQEDKEVWVTDGKNFGMDTVGYEEGGGWGFTDWFDSVTHWKEPTAPRSEQAINEI